MDLEPIEAIPVLPPRPADSHKGRFGYVLVHRRIPRHGRSGRAVRCIGPALGAGLVRVACPAEVQPTVASFEPSYMTYPLPCDDNGLIAFLPARPRARAADRAGRRRRGRAGARPVGRHPAARALLDRRDRQAAGDRCRRHSMPWSGQTELLSRLKRPVVLTPHPGEFARLSGLKTDEVQADRVAARRRPWRRSPSRSSWCSRAPAPSFPTAGGITSTQTGNPGMATAGAGDVLTGVIAALLAQKLPRSRRPSSAYSSTASRATSPAIRTARSA